MPFQNTYAEGHDVGLPGMLVNGENFNAFSRTIETAAGVAFGVPVARGAADRGVVIATVGSEIAGITRRNPALRPTNAGKYLQYEEAGIVDEGVMWVKAGGVVADGGQAYWDPATGLYVADNTKVKCSGMIFDTSGVAQQMVQLRIRIPRGTA